MQNYKGKFKNIFINIKNNKIEYIFLLFILLLATFLRFYKIPETLVFLGDEGRDALIVKRMIVDHDFTLIGPVTSVGNIYLGPLYYYMMIIPMWLFKLNPVGAAYMVAFIGVLTVFLVYYFGKVAFSKEVGLIASFLYAISSLVIKWSRSSWNPNPMPFFSLLLVFSLYKFYVEKKYWWFILTGVFFACCLQMHYFGFALLPLILLIWVLAFKEALRVKTYLKVFILSSLFSVLSFLVLMSPLFIFDLRHNLINYKAFIKFFTDRKPDYSLWRTIKNTEGRTQNLIGGLFTLTWNKKISWLFLLGILIGTFYGLLLKDKRKQTLLLIFWLGFGILGLASYYGDVYPHYLGFLFPAPFILISIFFAFLFKKEIGKLIVALFLIYFCYLNLKATPFKYPLYWNILKVKKLAQKIADDVNNPNFNIVWISSVKDYRAMNYRFFLEILGKKPLEPEDYPKAETLYVIVEGIEANPIKYPIWEIQSFGKAKIEKIIKEEKAPIVYKLVREK